MGPHPRLDSDSPLKRRRLKPRHGSRTLLPSRCFVFVHFFFRSSSHVFQKKILKHDRLFRRDLMRIKDGVNSTKWTAFRLFNMMNRPVRWWTAFFDISERFIRRNELFSSSFWYPLTAVVCAVDHNSFAYHPLFVLQLFLQFLPGMVPNLYLELFLFVRGMVVVR